MRGDTVFITETTFEGSEPAKNESGFPSAVEAVARVVEDAHHEAALSWSTLPSADQTSPRKGETPFRGLVLRVGGRPVACDPLDALLVALSVHAEQVDGRYELEVKYRDAVFVVRDDSLRGRELIGARFDTYGTAKGVDGPSHRRDQDGWRVLYTVSWVEMSQVVVTDASQVILLPSFAPHLPHRLLCPECDPMMPMADYLLRDDLALHVDERRYPRGDGLCPRLRALT